jgi:hypothetical protein
VTLDGSNIATVKLTVQNGNSTAVSVQSKSLFGVGGPIVFALILLPFERRHRLKMFLAIATLAFIGLWVSGCGSTSNSSFAKAGTYGVNVTSTTNGIASKATTIVVTVTK